MQPYFSQHFCPRILLSCYRVMNSGPDIISPKVTLLLLFPRHNHFSLTLSKIGIGTCATILGGAATCSVGFVNCFLRQRVPRAVGCTAAAMLPKQARETFRKHITKPSEQVAAPPSIPCGEMLTSRIAVHPAPTASTNRNNYPAM